MRVDALSLAHSSCTRNAHTGSWLDGIMPPQKKIRLMVQCNDHTLANDLYTVITAPDQHVYQASLCLALLLLTQKKVFFESWDRVFPIPDLYQSLLAEAEIEDFFSLSLEDVFFPGVAVPVHYEFSVLMRSAVNIEKVEQAALLSAFLLFNRKSITSLLVNDSEDNHVLSSSSQMISLLPCPIFLQPWLQRDYELTFIQALDSLFGSFILTRRPSIQKKLAEFVFSVLTHRHKYLQGMGYRKGNYLFESSLFASVADPLDSQTEVGSQPESQKENQLRSIFASPS